MAGYQLHVRRGTGGIGEHAELDTYAYGQVSAAGADHDVSPWAPGTDKDVITDPVIPCLVLPPEIQQLLSPTDARSTGFFCARHRRETRAQSTRAALTSLARSFFVTQGMPGGPDGHGLQYSAEVPDKEWTPPPKSAKGGVLRASPNTVFSPLSVRTSSDTLQGGDDGVGSSFEDAAANNHYARDSGVFEGMGHQGGLALPLQDSASFVGDGGDDVGASHSWLRRRTPGARADHSALLTPLAPSADDAVIHRRVAELRLALRTAEGALEKTRARLEDSEAARHEVGRCRLTPG